MTEAPGLKLKITAEADVHQVRIPSRPMGKGTTHPNGMRVAQLEIRTQRDVHEFQASSSAQTRPDSATK